MRAWREQTDKPSAEYMEKLAAYESKKAEWERLHPDRFLVDNAFPPSPPSRVSYNDAGISLHVYSQGGSYDIFPWKRIRAHIDILWWVQRLTNKTWCDRELIRDFVELSLEALKDKNVIGEEVTR